MSGERFVRPTISPEYTRYTLPDFPTRPIDEVTGLPYCFAPNPDLPDVVPRGQNLARAGDLDHQYPQVETKHGANPVLDLPYARMALMNLRLQWSTFEDHHDRWNRYPVIGPMQPGTPEQLAATLVFGLSGYVPPMALRLDDDSFSQVRLSNRDRWRMWESGQLFVANEGAVVGYLRSFVLVQEVDHIKENELDEFLCTQNRARKIELARILASKVVERAVEPFEAAYTQMHRQGVLSVRDPLRQKIVRAPATPGDLVNDKLTSGRRLGQIIDPLAQRLAQRRRVLRAA